MFPIAIIVAEVVAFLAVMSILTFVSMMRIDYGKYRIATKEQCLAIIKILRESPQEWSGVDDNPLIQSYEGDFAYFIRHETGVKLWVANGIYAFHIHKPMSYYIPIRYRIPMYMAYRRNKHRMQSSAAKDIISRVFS